MKSRNVIILSIVFFVFSVILILTGTFPTWIPLIFVGVGIVSFIYGISLRKSSR